MTSHSEASINALERAYHRKRARYDKARDEMVDALNALAAARTHYRKGLRVAPAVSDLGNRVAS